MSAFKQKNSIASVEFKKFKGIDTTAPHRENCAAQDMVNFRVLPDGSLQKRCGFEPIVICKQAIRGVWSGKLNGQTLIFVVYGNTVAKINPKEKVLHTIGTVAESTTAANFMFYNDILYLFDGELFYIVTETEVSEAEAYVPLYGKNWTSGKRGEVNEPLNLATRYVRMTYDVTEEISFLCVDQIISNIDAVYIDGELITDTDRYFFDKNTMSVCVSRLKIGEHVELLLTVSESDVNKQDLFSCERSVVFGDYTDNVLLLWDGNRKNVMFASCTVDEQSMLESRAFRPNSLPFYVPVKPAFELPKDDQHITGVCRQYDRLLIFTKDNAWKGSISSSPKRTLEAITVNPTYGCSSIGAAVTCGNSPVCVSNGSIVRWTAETDELNECNAYSISSQIDSLLYPSFFENAIAFIDTRSSEIFFSDPMGGNGTVWIYNYESENWYKFDGIFTKKMFMCDDTLGFVQAGTVYLFNDALGVDRMELNVQRDILATFESHPIDFFVGGNKKRLFGMTLNANFSHGNIRADYLSDGEVISSVVLKSQSLFPKSFIQRLNSKRFCYANLRLVSDPKVTQRIYSAGIWAKP